MNPTKLSHKRSLLVITISLSLITSIALSTLLIREAASQTTHEVKIANFAFVPQYVTISAGDTVKWNNTDAVIHTLWFVFISNGSTYLLSDPIPPSTVWSHTFITAPELQYYSFDKLWITGFINLPAGAHDVAVTNLNSAKTVICQECVGNITVTTENQGDFPETFNVTVYANATVIGEKSVSLPSGGSTDIVFSWNATGFSKGNYTLKAEADIVPGEVDTVDNTYIDGWVIVSMIGDITGEDGWPDGKCDIRDVAVVAKLFGVKYPDPDYEPNYDIIYDLKIDIKDIATVAKHFGEIDP